MKYESLSVEEQKQFDKLSETEKQQVLFDGFITKDVHNKTFSETRFDGWSFAEKLDFFKNINYKN